LDRGIRYDQTTLDEAVKYALLSIDSTIRSNVTVGPPIDLAIYTAGEMNVTRRRRFPESDPELLAIHAEWEQWLRKAVAALPSVTLDPAEPFPY
jgi:putative proteasome-type protease